MRRRDFLAALPLFAAGLTSPSVGRTAPALRVGAALPDPPFEFDDKDGPAGFDVTLMQRIAALIGREWRLERVPPHSNRGDSARARGRRVYRH